jgi:hypothetical protein
MKTAIFNRFSIDLPDLCVEQCSHSGDCDVDVSRWEPQISMDVTPQQLRDELREYGAWDESELQSHYQNRKRIIWIAAGNMWQ